MTLLLGKVWNNYNLNSKWHLKSICGISLWPCFTIEAVNAKKPETPKQPRGKRGNAKKTGGQAKPEVDPEIKPEVKAEVKPEVKPESKPEVKPAAEKAAPPARKRAKKAAEPVEEKTVTPATVDPVLKVTKKKEK